MQSPAARVMTAVWLATALAPLPAFGQTGENVAVVINDESPESQRVGEHYVRARKVPETNVIRIRMSPAQTITRAAYSASIEGPIAAALRRQGLQDRILFIVLTKGVPLRIVGTEGLEGTGASVDSELTLLYRRMVGQEVTLGGRVANPYYLAGAPTAKAEPFSHRNHDIYLVTRLDAFTVDEALALIDRAAAPSTQGRVVLDQRAGVLNNPAPDTWLAEAGGRLNDLGFADRVVLEQTRTPARNIEQVIGYSSWASNDPQNLARQSEMRFVPGAVVATFGGADARTFLEPPAEWSPSGNWQNKATWFGGAPTSLIGDLIREGATGVAGHVADPYLQSSTRPQILFPAYLGGFTLAEAFYLAMPHLSWQTVVVGDPLCRPFSGKTLRAAEIEDATDADTELPGLFAKRRLARLQTVLKGAPARAVTLLALAESRLSRGDAPGARHALEQATEVAPDLVAAQMQLALLYEQERDFGRARQRYEAILKLQPANVVALNNLAYGLAVYAKTPAEAKPLAEKAVALAPRDPTIADTLAWVEYLLGNHVAAARLIAFAVKGAPANAEIRLHAAFIYAARQEHQAALAEMKAALDADPQLRTREDVQELQRQLSKGGDPLPR
jgi:uncharacterized protein (TIGR03790 family)